MIVLLQDSDGEKSDQDLVVDDEHQPQGSSGTSGFQPTNGERSPRENGPNAAAAAAADKKKDPMSPRSDTSSHVSGVSDPRHSRSFSSVYHAFKLEFRGGSLGWVGVF